MNFYIAQFFGILVIIANVLAMQNAEIRIGKNQLKILLKF